MYRVLFNTILSRFDPETAHHMAMAVIRVLGVPPFGAAARAFTRPAPELACRSGDERFLAIRAAAEERGNEKAGGTSG